MTRFVTFGEIMVRLSTPGHQRFQQAMPGSLEVHFGGAEASVAGLLAHWGHAAAYVTALPDNPLGRACLANLRSLGVDVSRTRLVPAARMGLYFVEHGANQRSGQVIYDRDDSAFATAEAYDWAAVLEQADWFMVSGISPAVSAAAAEATEAALQQASSQGVRIACDVNFRSKLWRWDPQRSPEELAAETVQRMAAQSDLLVCGRGDAVALFGMSQDCTDEQLVRGLAEQHPNLGWVALTRRQSDSSSSQRFGASLLDVRRDQLVHAPPGQPGYEITHVVDRIGTGDAFTAALLDALSSPSADAPQRVVAWAAATACLAHSIEGDLSYVAREEVERLIDERGLGRIDR
jgi:2-dehydro-3-deoxygluconokinase